MASRIVALALWTVAALLASTDPPAWAEPHPPAQVNYMLHCQGCHLPDGAGMEGKVPALRGLVARFATVPGGREYLVRIPGSSDAPLTDAELAQVLNWVMHTFGPEQAARQATPFTAEEVAALRHPPLTRVSTVREELLLRMGAAGLEGTAR